MFKFLGLTELKFGLSPVTILFGFIITLVNFLKPVLLVEAVDGLFKLEILALVFDPVKS